MKFGGFVIFLTLFLGVYGGMHYYIYTKISLLLPVEHVYIAWVLALLVIAPILIQVLIKANWVHIARAIAGVGYTWMGFALVFFSFALINDALRGVLWLLGKSAHFGTPLLLLLSSHKATELIILLAMAACCYGIYAAKKINISFVRFPAEKFPPDYRRFRIVQISDLHLGILTSEARIQRMVVAINALQPDLIVSTGDLVDMQADHISKYAMMLRELHGKSGNYAVTGNHEAYAGAEGALAFTRAAGFTVLSGEGRQIENLVNLVGVDDPAVIQNLTSSPRPEVSVLQEFNNGHVTVLLKHQPIVNEASTAYVDLQLSGHVHGGQIFPFGLFTWLSYRVPMGMSQIASATWLYVSYGSGTWGPPIRFLAPSEITAIDILPAGHSEEKYKIA